MAANPLGARPIDGGRAYIMPSGEEVSRREFRARVREREFGYRITNEQYVRINRVITDQVNASRNVDLTMAEKREIAKDAARLGATKPGRNEQKIMWELLRKLDLPEEFEFIWGEDTSNE